MKAIHVRLTLLIGGLLLATISGCDKTVCCVNIDTIVDIHYQTQTGENLINSSALFGEENIRIYFKNGDSYDYVYNPNLDAKGSFTVNEEETGELLLSIHTSNIYEDNLSTTLIEFNENVVDTLVGEYDLSENSQEIKRVWLNGIALEDRPYVVVK